MLIRMPGLFIHIAHSKDYKFKTVTVEELKKILKTRHT
jgi:hypothetical protein